MTSTTRTGYIYRIWKPGSSEFYIGSTINLSRRKHNHKCSCSNAGDKNYNTPLYQHIRSNGDWKNWRMDVEHTVQFNQRHELNRVEGEYIRRLNPSLNNYIPGRTVTEWRQDNKQVIAERRKQHYQDNKEAILEYNKQYQQANKDKIKLLLNKKHDCLCGGKYTHHNKSIHFKTQRHQKYMTYMEYIKLYEYIVQT
jgi:hypothetical protein